MPCIIILFLIRFKMHLYLIESTHRKGYSNELASFFRINTFGRLNDGFISIFSSHVAKIHVWHDNLIPFQKADIFTITKALERFYDVKIILSPDIQTGKTYSGVLKRKSNIESVLKSLQNSIPIDYKIVGNNIFISPK